MNDHSLAERLRLKPSVSTRMLVILGESAELVPELRPEWYRVRIDGHHLRLFCGRLIVMTLEGDYVWLATEPNVQPVNFSRLASWRDDKSGVRPYSAKSAPYPEYKTPPSRNGFYCPSEDPYGTDWETLRVSHIEYLRLASQLGRAPDHRTGHDESLAADIRVWSALSSKPVFESSVRDSLLGDAETRRARLRAAPRKPSARLLEVRVFDRNPDVVAEVLSRAAGICELCRSPAPFQRSSDGTPYL